MKSLRLQDVDRGQPFEIEVDGAKLTAYPGETLATALVAAGIRTLVPDNPADAPGRVYCNMGVCQQCLVTVDRQPNCRACQTLAQPGMRVETHP